MLGVRRSLLEGGNVQAIALPPIPAAAPAERADAEAEPKSSDVARFLSLKSGRLEPGQDYGPDSSPNVYRQIFGDEIRRIKSLILDQYLRGRAIEIGSGALGGIAAQLGIDHPIEETDYSEKVVAARQRDPSASIVQLDAQKIAEHYGARSLDTVIGDLALDSMNPDIMGRAIGSIAKALKPGGTTIHFVDAGANNGPFLRQAAAKGLIVFPSRRERLEKLLVPEAEIEALKASLDPGDRDLVERYLKAGGYPALRRSRDPIGLADRLSAIAERAESVLRVSPNEIYLANLRAALKKHGLEEVEVQMLFARGQAHAGAYNLGPLAEPGAPMPNQLINEAGDLYARHAEGIEPGTVDRQCGVLVIVAKKPDAAAIGRAAVAKKK